MCSVCRSTISCLFLHPSSLNPHPVVHPVYSRGRLPLSTYLSRLRNKKRRPDNKNFTFSPTYQRINQSLVRLWRNAERPTASSKRKLIPGIYVLCSIFSASREYSKVPYMRAIFFQQDIGWGHGVGNHACKAVSLYRLLWYRRAARSILNWSSHRWRTMIGKDANVHAAAQFSRLTHYSCWPITAAFYAWIENWAAWICTVWRWMDGNLLPTISFLDFIGELSSHPRTIWWFLELEGIMEWKTIRIQERIWILGE